VLGVALELQDPTGRQGGRFASLNSATKTVRANAHQPLCRRDTQQTEQQKRYQFDCLKEVQCSNRTIRTGWRPVSAD
jgi:hypothetical protein